MTLPEEHRPVGAEPIRPDQSPPVLDAFDESWINELTPEPVSIAWLHIANQALQVGVTCDRYGGRRLDDAVPYARQYFYADLLGFDRPESPLYKQYLATETRRFTVPADRFVSVMRLFHQGGLSVRAGAKLCFSGWALELDALRDRIDGIKTALGDEAARKVISVDPSVLAYRSYAKKVGTLGLIASQLDWPRENVTALILAKPALANSAISRTVLLARYIAAFSEQPVTASRAGNLLFESPDKHLVALDRGVLHGVHGYSHPSIRKITEGMTPAELKAEAAVILADPLRAAIIDAPTRFAHRRFHTLKANSARKSE